MQRTFVIGKHVTAARPEQIVADYQRSQLTQREFVYNDNYFSSPCVIRASSDGGRPERKRCTPVNMGNRPHCDNGEGGGFHATPLPSACPALARTFTTKLSRVGSPIPSSVIAGWFIVENQPVSSLRILPLFGTEVENSLNYWVREKTTFI